jgi:hypothetical protein
MRLEESEEIKVKSYVKVYDFIRSKTGFHSSYCKVAKKNQKTISIFDLANALIKKYKINAEEALSLILDFVLREERAFLIKEKGHIYITHRDNRYEAQRSETKIHIMMFHSHSIAKQSKNTKDILEIQKEIENF